MSDRPDYIDGDAQGWWHLLHATLRADPTGRQHLRRVYLDPDDCMLEGGMSPESARALADHIIAAADYAESGGSDSKDAR